MFNIYGSFKLSYKPISLDASHFIYQTLEIILSKHNELYVYNFMPQQFILFIVKKLIKLKTISTILKYQPLTSISINIT